MAFITLHSRDLFPSLDLLFFPPSFFSFFFSTSIFFIAFLPVFSLPVTMRSGVIVSLWRPWIWPLVSSRVNFIHLCKFSQESKRNKPVFSEPVMYLCTIVSLMAGANFLCLLYSWHIICYDTMPRVHFQKTFHTDWITKWTWLTWDAWKLSK